MCRCCDEAVQYLVQPLWEWERVSQHILWDISFYFIWFCNALPDKKAICSFTKAHRSHWISRVVQEINSKLHSPFLHPSESPLSLSVTLHLWQENRTQERYFFYAVTLTNARSCHWLCLGSTQKVTQLMWGKRLLVERLWCIWDKFSVKENTSERRFKELSVWKMKLSVAEAQFSSKGVKWVILSRWRESLQHKTSGNTFDFMWLLIYLEKIIYLLFIFIVLREIGLCITCLYVNIIIIFPKPVRSWTLANHLALDAKKNKNPSQVKATNHMKTYWQRWLMGKW